MEIFVLFALALNCIRSYFLSNFNNSRHIKTFNVAAQTIEFVNLKNTLS